MPTVSSLDAVVSVKGVSEATKQLNSMDQATKSNQSGFKGFLSSMLSSVSAISVTNLLGDAFGFLKDQLGDMFKESMDAQAGMAQTVSVLKSTHDASGQTAQGIADLAGSLSHLTMFSDDTIQSAENMLLTFTNIGKNVFPTATKTVLDMSQALGQDTKTSAIQLGKALNDPIAGISSLTRVGVTFTSAQKDLIKQLVATGDTAGAQKVILKELGTEFGHSATDAGKTFPGQLKILGQSLADVKQTIGDALLPILRNFVSFITANIVPNIQKFATMLASPQFAQFAQVVGTTIVNGVKGLITVIGTIISIGVNLVNFFKNNQVAAALLVGVLSALVVGAIAFAITAIPPLVAGFIAWAIAAGAAAIATLAAAAPFILIGLIIALVVAGIILAIKNWGSIMHFIQAVVGAVAGWIGDRFRWVGDRLGELGKVFSLIRAVIGAQMSQVGSTVRGITDHIGQAFSNMGSLIHGVWDGIVGAIRGAINSVISAINGFLSGLNSIHIDIGSVHIGVSIPLIPYLATGVENFVGGLAIVGERGPELVSLPRGASVYPNSSMGQWNGGGAQTIQVEVYLNNQAMARQLVGPIVQEIRYGIGSHF